MRRSYLFSGLTLAALAAACDSPSAPVAPAPVPAATRYECRGDVAARVVTCSVPTPSGARGDVLLGNQGVHTRLTSSNVAVVADSFMFDETVTNLLNVPIGTTDGTTPDPDGVQVFFTGPIATTAGTGTVDVANADGVGTFTASNQPFFAYHEIIAPSATSSAKRWKLRFDPGVQKFSFTLLVSAPYPPGSGSVYMTVLTPNTSTPQEDSVPILVQVDSSSAAVASMVATAAGRTAVLHPSSPGRMAGVLDLSGIAPQTLELRVLATTVNGDTGVALRSFVKDARPRVVLGSPTEGTVARPNLHIDVDCVDDDPAGCASLSVEADGNRGRVVVASGTTSIDTVVSMTGYDYASINVYATDSRGRSPRVTTTVEVYVVTSPFLVPIDSAGIRVMDVDSARLLYVHKDNSVRIHDRVAGTHTLLANTTPTSICTCPSSGYLHPQGAIWVHLPPEGIGGGLAVSRLYDWRSGWVSDLGPAGGVTVAGTWAAWTWSGVLKRLDLATGALVTVTSNGDYPAVAPNGDVVYTGISTLDLYRYRDGTTDRLTLDNDTHHDYSAVTDGTNILFTRRTPGATPPYNIALIRDGTLSLISSSGGFDTGSYAAAGGWIAYEWYDGSGVRQIRTRSPGGDDRQATHGTGNSSLRALSADGTLAYTTGPHVSNQSLYVLRAPYTATPTLVMREFSTLRLRFHGTELILLLGNTAFDVNY